MNLMTRTTFASEPQKLFFSSFTITLWLNVQNTAADFPLLCTLKQEFCLRFSGGKLVANLAGETTTSSVLTMPQVQLSSGKRNDWILVGMRYDYESEFLTFVERKVSSRCNSLV